MADLADKLNTDRIEELIAKSSFGTPGARGLRDRTSQETADEIVERVAAASTGLDDVVIRGGNMTAVVEAKWRSNYPQRDLDAPDHPLGAGREQDDQVYPRVAAYLRARLDTTSPDIDIFARAFCRWVRLTRPETRNTNEFAVLALRTACDLTIEDEDKLRSRFKSDEFPARSQDSGRLMATLGPRQRDLMILRIVLGLSAAHTGQILGMSAGNVRVTQHRALAALRRKLSSATTMPKSPEAPEPAQADTTTSSETQPAQPLIFVSYAHDAEGRENAQALVEALLARDGKTRLPTQPGIEDALKRLGLTVTERMIVEQMAEGRSNREIAQYTAVSVRTVERRITRLCRKLGITSQRDIANFVAPQGHQR